MIGVRTLSLSRSTVALAAAFVLPLLVSQRAEAQALNYPAMQVPSVSERDYSGVVVGSNGTMMMFQWREGYSNKMHLGLDAGLYDPSGEGSRAALFVAGNFGYDLGRSRSDQPFDLLLTGGAGLSIANERTSFRVPVGLSIGHTFELDQGMAVTPFVHPRISLDYCSSCSRGGGSAADFSLNFDVGGSFNINPRLSVRASLLFSGADQYGADDALAVGITWTPDALRR